MTLPRLSLCTALVLTALSTLNAQSVATNPVGAISFAANAPSNGQAESFAYNAISLARPSVAIGKISSQTNGSSTTLVDNSATWADNAFNPAAGAKYPTHYIEFISGALTGLTFDITGTSAVAKSITVDADLSASALAESAYRIRPHWTLASLFGATPTGIQRGTATTADLINLWTGSSYTIFYHRQSATQNGWRTTNSVSADEADAVVFPDQGIFFKRRGTTALSLPIIGEVRGDEFAVSVAPGFNLISGLSAKDITLDESGLYSGSNSTGVKAGTATSADLVSIWDGSSFLSYYVRSTVAGGVQGWRSTTNVSVDTSSTKIPAGSAIIVRRQSDVPAFVWNRPGQTF